MGYTFHCVPGNHPFDEAEPGSRFVNRIDPRYPPEVQQNMRVYGCSEHESLLDVHCADWQPHQDHEQCPGTPDTETEFI